ncbi:MAG: FAD:protein FMN transferase [Verrucomicrobia bacterium]|nr:FAD:protein FMN transferase [Verrucomicrobiota bacterium]
MRRRAFIALLGAGGAGACFASQSPRLVRHEYEQPQMGVPFRIVLYASDEPHALTAVRAAFDRIAQINAALSDYEEDSELSRLSRSSGSGTLVRISEDLWRVLDRAQRVARASDGAFDVTCGPLVHLWRRARRQRALPEPAKLEEARRATGFAKLSLADKPRGARLVTPGMRLDLGGIAKGFAADEAMKALRAHGVTRALVSGGGDMAVGDAPPGRSGWRVELAAHDAPGAPATEFIELEDCGFATSGDLFQHVEISGRRYSHIVDPRTGIGLTDHSLVFVIAPDAMRADSLSTAVSVLGPVAGLKLVARTSGAEARIVRKPLDRIETAESPGFARYRAWK